MNGIMETFNEGRWGGMIKNITVFNKMKMVFTFKEGLK
jgi:hypothetical protein